MRPILLLEVAATEETGRATLPGQPARRWARRLAWLPIPLIALVAAAFYRFDSGALHESLVLVATLSAIFRTSTALLIAYLAARTYLVAGSRAVLALGCGALTFGIASFLAPLLLVDRNEALMVHNTGLCLAGACFLLSAVWALKAYPVASTAPALHVVLGSYLAVSLAMGLLLWGALAGALPDFFAAQGFTALRQEVLGLAFVEFALASLCTVILYGRSRTPFLKWYGIGLALIGMGVAVIIVEGSPGTALSWVGRLSQFLGGLYMLVGVVTVAEGRWGWQIPLEQALYRIEEHNQALREAFCALADHLPDSVDRVDRAFRHLYVNPAAARMLGLTPVEVIGKTNRELGVSDPSAGIWEERVRQVFATGQPLDVEDQFPTAGGRRYFQSRYVAERARDGTVTTVLAVSRDTTGRRLAEAERERLLDAERQARLEAEAALRTREEFLSVAAHELKTPITSLRGYAELTLKRMGSARIDDPQEIRRAFETINRQADRLAILANQLLDLSLLETGELTLQRQETDLVPLVRSLQAAMQPATTRHTLSLQAPPSLVANVDPERLRLILYNLLDNAIKYSPHGGPVEVELSAPDPRSVRVAVRDHGTGIPPERRSQLFTRYFKAGTQRPAGGLGLGLYIGQQLVALHGGALTAEFPEDGGSRFVVTLPAAL